MKWGPFGDKDVKQGFYHLEKALGNINAVKVVVDFGAGSTSATGSATGLKWVKNTTVFAPAVVGIGANAPSASIINDVGAGISRILPGLGIEVLATAPSPVTGKYEVHIIGVNDE